LYLVFRLRNAFGEPPSPFPAGERGSVRGNYLLNHDPSPISSLMNKKTPSLFVRNGVSIISRPLAHPLDG
jgi:hypothetical protein